MTTTKTLKTSRQYRKRAAVPYIRLSGEWLRVAGIQPGTSIVVNRATGKPLSKTLNGHHYDPRGK